MNLHQLSCRLACRRLGFGILSAPYDNERSEKNGTRFFHFALSIIGDKTRGLLDETLNRTPEYWCYKQSMLKTQNGQMAFSRKNKSAEIDFKLQLNISSVFQFNLI